jgi:replicative superfamily II helicase
MSAKIKVLIVSICSFWIACTHTSFGQQKTTYYLTPIEVQTAIEITDQLHYCDRSYDLLYGICVEQNQALKFSENLVDTLNYQMKKKEQLTDTILLMNKANIKSLEKELKRERRNKVLNGVLMYVASGVAIVELGIILAK